LETQCKEAGGRRQRGGGKKVCTVSFLAVFNGIVISAMLHSEVAGFG
jgi:hypothetical protein